MQTTLASFAYITCELQPARLNERTWRKDEVEGTLRVLEIGRTEAGTEHMSTSIAPADKVETMDLCTKKSRLENAF